MKPQRYKVELYGQEEFSGRELLHEAEVVTLAPALALVLAKDEMNRDDREKVKQSVVTELENVWEKK